MKWTGKTMIGAILIITGFFIFLNTIGINAGKLIGLLIAILLIVYGMKQMNNGKSTFKRGLGAAILILGLLSLVGAAHLFFGVLVAVAIIYYGMKMLKTNKQVSDDDDHHPAPGKFEAAISHVEDSFEKEWFDRI